MTWRSLAPWAVLAGLLVATCLLPWSAARPLPLPRGGFTVHQSTTAIGNGDLTFYTGYLDPTPQWSRHTPGWGLRLLVVAVLLVTAVVLRDRRTRWPVALWAVATAGGTIAVVAQRHRPLGEHASWGVLAAVLALTVALSATVRRPSG